MRDCDRGAKVMLHVATVSNKDIEVVNSTDGGTRLCELEMIEQSRKGFVNEGSCAHFIKCPQIVQLQLP